MWARHVASTFLLVITFVLAGSQNAIAAWSTNPALNNAISTAAGGQSSPTIISDGSGGAIITWTDYRIGESDIYAQRINASGAVQWTADGVAISTAANHQNSPTITGDGSGGAIITWTDYRGGTGYYNIYAQRINSSGAVQWTADGVGISTAAGVQMSPTITGDGSGGAIITWMDSRSGVTADIYAQRINASGAVQWTADGVAVSTAAGDQLSPTITGDASGGAIITWHDTRSGAYDIYAQRINASGAVQWTADGVAISTATGNQGYPTIISAGSGGAIITWWDYRSGASGIYAQRINASGAVQWTADGVAVSTAAGGQQNPTTIGDGSGGAIITWQDHRSAVTADIYAQRINASGAVQWTADGAAISTAANDQIYPTITGDGSGGAIITWYDSRSGTEDIYAQRINASGAVQWTADGVAISTAAYGQASPTITGDGSGGAIITWHDSRSGEFDIYAQRISASIVIVTANSNGNGAGAVASDVLGVSYAYPAVSAGTATLLVPGADVIVTATAGTGSTASWGGTCTAVGGVEAGNGTTSATCAFTSLAANKAVAATFTLNSYTVSATAGSGGAISPTSQAVNHGSTTTFTVTPNTGYSIASVSGCGGSLNGATYTTGAITGACAVSATFTINSYAVTATAGPYGWITPGNQLVNHGSTTTFTVSPVPGYAAVMGGTCGGTLVGTTYTTNAITGPCTVTATFTAGGSLRVNMLPAGAVADGAKWSVDGGVTWNTNGATVSGLLAGTQTISFNSVAGWTAPANQTVSITTGQTTTATGTYTAVAGSTGSLTVTMSPADAVTAGARWSVDGGAWQTSDATVTGLTAGRHTVAFNTLDGYTSPPNQAVTITLGQTTTLTGTYTAVAGSGAVKVRISPEGAVRGGAQWSVDGGTTWNASGDTLIGLSAGSHTVTFNDVAGYTTPDDRIVNITDGETVNATGMYKQYGSLKVTISPAEAVTGGAEWSIDGGTTWNASGDTLLDLATGSYTLSFSASVTNYSPPANKTVKVTPGQTTTATGTYTSGYTVLGKASTGGTVTPEKKVVSEGSTVTFTVRAKPGYTTNAIVGGTCSAGSWSGAMYTTDAVTEACTVSFTFTKAPTATTGSATNIMQAGVTLNGKVNPENASTTVTFEYGADTNYGTTVSAGVLTGSKFKSVAAPVTGLMCETTYHYRVLAVNAVDTTPGNDRTFKTAACMAPRATTLGASNITQTGATLKGVVNPKKATTTVTFEYGPDTNYGTTVSAGSLSDAMKPVSVAVTGLTCNAQYHFRVVAVNAVDTTAGLDRTFTTSACADSATDSNMVKAPISDFDGDGKSDIVFRDVASGQTAVWMMNGASVTSNALTSTNAGVYTSTTGWQAQGIGDFDGDGKNDLLWRDAESGQVAVWMMNGVDVVTSAMTSLNPGAGWLVQGIGDFDGDGKSDILWRDASTGQTAIWFMSGATVTSSSNTNVSAGAYTATAGWQVHGVGDFNGDNKSDILWRQIETGRTAIWFMSGASKVGGKHTSVQAGAYTSTTGWQIHGVGDFNGDGKADILWRNAESGGTVVWFMNGVKRTGRANTSVQLGAYTSATGWHVQAVGDFDGDGKSDVLVRYAGTGQTYVWLMNGAVVTGDWTSVNAGAYDSATGLQVLSEETIR
ncbi:MAG: FG-GAP repeat protein [Nitrospinae bacterium]|nr:FG-GAP repeat protein [Nitrospinota bacterium]